VTDATEGAQNAWLFSNEKEILQNLPLTKKEFALNVHAGEWIIHPKS